MKNPQQVQIEYIINRFKNYNGSGYITRKLNRQVEYILNDFIPLAENKLKQLNNEIAQLQEDISIMLDKTNRYPTELKELKSSLLQYTKLKKGADAYINGLKSDLDTGKLKRSPNDKVILHTLFIGDDALYPINIKPIIRKRNITRALQESLARKYAIEWLWLCLNHYYGISNNADFVYAILERTGIKLDMSVYFKPSVIKDVVATQEGKAYLDTYFPAPKIYSSLPEKYLDAFLTLLLHYFSDLQHHPRNKSLFTKAAYKYCLSYINDDKKRMQIWRGVCRDSYRTDLTDKEVDDLITIYKVQPELLESSESALLKLLDSYIESYVEENSIWFELI